MFEQDGRNYWESFFLADGDFSTVSMWENGKLATKEGNVKGKKEISIQERLVKIYEDIHYTEIPGLLNDPKYLSMLRNLMFSLYYIVVFPSGIFLTN